MWHTAHLASIIILLSTIIFFLPRLVHADFNNAVIAYDTGKYRVARENFLALAEKGHAGAEFMLGVMRFHGRGVKANDGLAAIWFYKSAIKGNPTGQLAFGSLYIRGLGVRQDLVKAYGWLSLAARQAVPGLQQKAIALKDKAANLMNADEIADAQRWAIRFKPQPAGLIIEEKHY